jgi:hypothetical protein
MASSPSSRGGRRGATFLLTVLLLDEALYTHWLKSGATVTAEEYQRRGL